MKEIVFKVVIENQDGTDQTTEYTVAKTASDALSEFQNQKFFKDWEVVSITPIDASNTQIIGLFFAMNSLCRSGASLFDYKGDLKEETILDGFDLVFIMKEKMSELEDTIAAIEALRQKKANTPEAA